MFARKLLALSMAGCISLSSGCATLAHRNSYDGKNRMHCDQQGNVCPWLVGDALLLLPGIVPGVIAFIVDFGTGAWNHDLAGGRKSNEDDSVADAR